MRRIFLSRFEQIKGKLVALTKGIAGEEFQSEVYQAYGLSANPEQGGESVLLEINGDADNYVALAPSGVKIAEVGETLIYFEDTVISLKKESVTIKVGSKSFELKDGKVKTNMDIETTGNIKAKSLDAEDVKATSKLYIRGGEFANHIHPGVRAGSGVTGGAI